MMFDRTFYDGLTKEQVLDAWQSAKEALAECKEHEMGLRKYIVEKAFGAQAEEGTNKIELEDGSTLKAVVKYNYKLEPDHNKIRQVASTIMAMGNQGSFIVERIFKWSCDLSLSEYRKLQEGETNEIKEIKKLVDQVLIIDQAAPTLELKAAKK